MTQLKRFLLFVNAIFRSPEPKAQLGELIVYPWSGVVVVIHNFQTSSPQKPLVQSEPNFMWSLLGKGGPKFV